MFSHLCFLCLLDDDANNLIGRDRDECECAVTMYAKADTIWLWLSDMSCSSSFSSLMRNHWQLARDPFRLALSRMCRPFTSNGFVIILISRILFFVSSFVERAPIIFIKSFRSFEFIYFFFFACLFLRLLSIYTHILDVLHPFICAWLLFQTFNRPININSVVWRFQSNIPHHQVVHGDDEIAHVCVRFNGTSETNKKMYSQVIVKSTILQLIWSSRNIFKKCKTKEYHSDVYTCWAAGRCAIKIGILYIFVHHVHLRVVIDETWRMVHSNWYGFWAVALLPRSRGRRFTVFTLN